MGRSQPVVNVPEEHTLGAYLLGHPNPIALQKVDYDLASDRDRVFDADLPAVRVCAHSAIRYCRLHPDYVTVGIHDRTAAHAEQSDVSREEADMNCDTHWSNGGGR